MTAADARNVQPTTRPTKAAGAADRTVRTIAETIIAGRLNPGERLPTERALAGQLQVSRNTVREAIRSLEAMGVVEVRRGDGSYVTSLEPHYLLDTAAFVTRLLRDHTVLEMFEVRAILESAATAMAAARMTEADHAELRQQVRRIEEANSVEDILSADLAFHGLIAAASGNAMLVSLLETFSAKTYRARYLKSKIDSDKSLANLQLAHAAVLEAIVLRDPEAARVAAGAHVQVMVRWLRPMLTAREQ
jgi:GntR family transcriptional repressor for pyruvate dehydrogenase complex